jgi:hypothetical protein
MEKDGLQMRCLSVFPILGEVEIKRIICREVLQMCGISFH